MSDELLIGELCAEVIRLVAQKSEAGEAEPGFWVAFTVSFQVKSAPAYEPVRQRWPDPALDEALRRSGLYEEAVRGDPLRPTAIVGFLNRFLGRPRVVLSALEVWGMEECPDALRLGAGFSIRRFSAAEVSAWNPPSSDSHLDPHITAQYWFVVSESASVLRQHGDVARFTGPRSVGREPFWTEGWWKPFLCLNLFQTAPVHPGVALQGVPGWSLEKLGEFDGEMIDQDGSGRSYWQRTDSREHQLDATRAAELSEFAGRLMPSIERVDASPEEGPRFRAAARAFLRANQGLPRVSNVTVLDLGELEDCLFDMVRAADGLVHGEPHPTEGRRRLGLQSTFIRRVRSATEFPSDVVLRRSYELRSGLAHAYTDAEIRREDAQGLAPIVRRTFLSYLGAIEACGLSRPRFLQLLNARTPPSQAVRDLWALAKA